MRNLALYVASPFGFSEAGRFFYEHRFLPMLRLTNFMVIDPWSLTDKELIRAADAITDADVRKAAWETVNRKIGMANEIAICRSSLLVAVLDGSDVDSGTASEIGFAAGLNKRIIGYRGDFRLSSDNVGCTVNLQVEYFIERQHGKIYTSLAELMPAVQAIYVELAKETER
jgi:nucleoside 2-deoxyribosyltransferase